MMTERIMKNVAMVAMAGMSVLCWRTASADTWTNESGVVWTYTIANGQATVGGGSYSADRAVSKDTVGDIVIPSELGGCQVTSIGQFAFVGCTNLTGVVIPNTVTRIGDMAFYKSRIRSIAIGVNVQTIGTGCFQDCSRLLSIEIPDSVTSIGNGAFANCSSLRTLRIGNGLTTVVYKASRTFNYAFSTGSSSSSYITLQENAFGGLSSLVKIEFGSGLQELSWDSFYYSTNLKYVSFSGNLPGTVSKTMPGASGHACYVTHEAYPDGLPSSTWAGVPLKYLEGRLPSEEDPYDLVFHCCDGWPSTFFLSSETNSTVACTNFLAGEPIYCSFSCIDAWGDIDIVSNYTNTLYVSGSDKVAYAWRDHLPAGVWVYWHTRIYDNLQNLPPGEYTATWVLNEPRAIRETNYANNSNTVTFVVVPSTEVTFVSDGNTIAVRKYGIGNAYGTFPASPTRSGFRFIGWFTEEEGGDVVTATTKVPDSPVTLHAHWTIIPRWDLVFRTRSGAAWPAPVFLTDKTNSLESCTKFVAGNPIYLTGAYWDALQNVAIKQNISNTLHVVGIGVDKSSIAWKDGLDISWYAVDVSRLYDCLQNLPIGEYTFTYVLNEPHCIYETNYANNTNTIMFTVVPSTEVVFMHDGNVFTTRYYEKGGTFTTLPDAPFYYGYEFIGWFTEEEGGDVVTATTKVPDSPVTLYAHWNTAIKQTQTVGGTLSSGMTRWIAGNLYKVTSDLVVPSGATLDIDPGVVVKFAAGKSLIVNAGGSLEAEGIRALPIVFTSIKDDANGGDTNEDGAATTPQPGDWCQIKVSGTANLNYTKVLYTSSKENYGGIEAYGGVVNFDSSEIAHTRFECVNAHSSGKFTARNSVFADSSLGFGYYGSNRVRAYNCVFAGLTTAIRQSGKLLANCIFYECQQFTDQSGDGSSFKNCVFFNPVGHGAQRYVKCGKDGNVWADPLFFDPENGDFRVAANSPCVDAADGSVAPEFDYYGSPRMNVTGVRPTGSAAANGAVPDIGIYEVQGDGDIPSADLTVTAVTASESLTVGEEVEISWTVKNVGEETASGVWRDEIEIVAANGQTFAMGMSISQTEIQPGASANFRATVAVPAAPEGAVQVRVTVNKQQDLFEAMRSENNVGTTTATLNVPTLAVPSDGSATTITLGGDSDIGFALDGSSAVVTQGGVLVIRGTGELDTWLGNGAIAAKDNAIRTAVKIADDTLLLQIPAGSEPRVTIRNDGNEDAELQLSLEVGDFLLYKVDMVNSGGANVATVRFWGNGFDESVSCWLEERGERIEATDITIDSGVFAHATFTLPNSSASTMIVSGNSSFLGYSYNFHVDKAGTVLDANLTVPKHDASPSKWYGEVDVADVIRSGRAYVGTFRYGNSGGASMLAPYVTLTAKGKTLIRLRETDAWSKTVAIMATSDSYPASVLKPGDSSKETFFYKTTGTTAEIEYAIAHASGTEIPWDDFMASLRPSWATEQLWGFAKDALALKIKEQGIKYIERAMPIYASVAANQSKQRNVSFEYDGSVSSHTIGGIYAYGEYETEDLLSWNKFLNCMRYDCDHLMKIGTPEKRISRLWMLELNEALGNDMALSRLASAIDLSRSGRGFGVSFMRFYSASLRGRFSNGTLGYGWTDNFATYAELQDAETLVFNLPSGGSYFFTKETGAWQPEDARDKTMLKETADSYVLAFASGTVQTFAKSNMRTASIRDNQGNELTFTYSDSQLQKVQHTDGQFLEFTYSNGKLSKISDDQGRTATYTYTGNLLTSVTAFNGLVTRYDYIADSGSPTDHALSKITYPDGTMKEFTYDERGRVAASSVNGGQFMTEIVRGDFGCYSIVAQNGSVTEVTVGASGETLKVVNARGETFKQAYTSDTMLESMIAPSGKRNKITYGKDGSPIAAMTPSGASSSFSYEPDFNNLASVTDAKGHTLNYSYDELGRSTAVSYVDGSSSSLEYDDRGDVVRSTNRRGEAIEYEYDGEGNLTKKTWPNGRTFTLAYDAKGNVTNAADSVTGAVTMEYDANERLTRIVYPKGRGFTYTYDEFGRVTERTMLGRAASPLAADIQRYTYDTLGRLATVTDGDGNPYLTNVYDPTTGWLITQTYGNGTVVSNAYDILGRTIGIYHLKTSQTSQTSQTLAFFEYAYDSDGKCISQTTAEGTESYTYDADGQLIAVTYPDGTSESFAYDAVGNRITHTGTTGVSPVDEAYTVNALNQYTSLRDSATPREETLEYDLDGNMTRKGDTLYYYDTLNRLVAVTNTTKNIHWSCEYDVFGNRVSVTDNGTTTERLFVQGSLPSVAAEYNGETLSKSHILVGAVRIADLTGTTGVSPVASSARYYHADMLGSARLLTDGSGATKGTSSFKAFGETRKSSGETTDAGYVGTLGVETDSSGLLFMRNRYYHAGMGRFVQMDPIGFKSEEIDLYRYCGNSPTFSVDMNGCEHITVCGHEIDRSVRRADYAPFGKDSSVFGDFAVTAYVYPNDINNNGFYCPYDPSSIYVWNGAPAQSLTAVHEYIHAWLTYKYPSIANTFETEYLAWYLSRYYWYKKGRLPHMPSWREIVNSVDEAYNGRNHHWNIPMAAEIVEKIRRDVMRSLDPNEISGPLGTGEKRYVQQGEWMNYTIYFENKTNATAAAQEVFVDLPMDENLDWSTLELGEIAFGDHIDTSLSGKSHGKASYAMPGTNTFVRTTVTMKDGVLSWYMRDWDPTTSDNFPASATGGFLPPNNPETHCGEGHLSFRVKVKSDAPDGAIIRASAQIVFDQNPMIETDPSWWNTVGENISIANFTASEVEAAEGDVLTFVVTGGNTNAASSVDVYLTYNTAAAADLDFAKAKVNGVLAKNLKFPLTLNWAKGEVGEKVITIPVKTDNAVEGDEFFTLQLANAVGVEIGDVDVCTVTIKDANSYVTLQDGVTNPNIKVSTSGAGKWTVGVGSVSDEDGLLGVYHAESPALARGQRSTLSFGTWKGTGVFTYSIRFIGDPDEEVQSSLALYNGEKLIATLYHKEIGNEWMTRTITATGSKTASRSYRFVFTQGSDPDTHVEISEIWWNRDGSVSTYDVWAWSDGSDGGHVTGSGPYLKGQTAKLTAKPLPGWTFDGWYEVVYDEESDDLEFELLNSSATMSYKVTTGINVMAFFSKIPYVRALADPADGGKVTGGGLCEKGKKVTLKATANKNFTFVEWVAASTGETPVVPVATTASLVIDRTAKPAADSKTSTTLTNVAEDVTYYAVFKSDPEIFVTVDATDGAGAEPTGKGAGKYVAGTITGMGKYAPGKTKIALKATANKGYVFAGWLDANGELLTKDATYTIAAMGESDVEYTAQFVTSGEDKESITLALAMGVEAEAFGLSTNEIVSITNFCGVAMNWPLTATALSATTIKVAGLPTGLKFTAKDIMKKGSKTEVEIPANTIYGAPTAASKVDKKTGAVTPAKVVFTVTTAGKSTQTFAIDLYIDPLPAWAVGTFDGVVGNGESGTGNGESASAEATADERGTAALTIAANGKISGKLLRDDGTWTLSADSFASYDATNDVYLAIVIGKAGKEIVTNEVTVSAADATDGTSVVPVKVGVVNGRDVRSPSATGETPVVPVDWTAYQNLWKRADTKAGMPVIKKDIKIDHELVEGDANNKLTLTFKKDGAVAFAGKVDGTKVSGSSQLVLRLAETGSPYQVTLYAPPKTTAKPPVESWCKTFAVTLTVDEQTAEVKVEVAAE